MLSRLESEAEVEAEAGWVASMVRCGGLSCFS